MASIRLFPLQVQFEMKGAQFDYIKFLITHSPLIQPPILAIPYLVGS